MEANNTQRLVTSGVFIALSAVLSLIILFKLPYGGSITLVSMLPIMTLGYMYGVRWGLLCGAVYGLVQALLGAVTSSAFAGITGFSVVLMFLLDYIFAFASIGTAGAFKNKINNSTLAFLLGALLAGLLRLTAHFISGVLLWGSYAKQFFSSDVINAQFAEAVLNSFSGTALAMLYSIIYNGSYMLAEIIITEIAIVAVMQVKPLRKLIVGH